MVENQGFDIEHKNEEKEGKWFEYPYKKGVEFCISYISKTDLKAISRAYTTQGFDEKHQKVLIEDPEKKKEAIDGLIIEKIVGWRGIRIGSTEAPFNTTNLKALLDKFGDRRADVEIDPMTNEKVMITLSSWIMRTALDPENFIDQGDVENLPTTSKANGTGTMIGRTGD